MVAARPELCELAGGLAAAVSRLSRQLAGEGLPVNRTRLSVLVMLQRGGPLRITDLAAGEHVAQPSMTSLVSRLEEQGWVERRPDPADGRAVKVAITPAGAAVLERAIALRDEALYARLARLSAKDQAALASALAALSRLVEE